MQRCRGKQRRKGKQLRKNKEKQTQHYKKDYGVLQEHVKNCLAK